MKRLILLFLIAMAITSTAAITDRYVADVAAGTGDGTSEADAMSYTNFLDYMVTGGSFTAAAGDRFNIKTGSYTSRGATSDVFSNGGTSTSPVIIRGYSTTPGDGYQGRASNGLLVTTNMPAWTYTTGALTFSNNWIVVESIRVSAASAATGVSANSTNGYITKCRFSNASIGAGGIAISINTIGSLIDNDFILTNGTGAGNYAVYSNAAGAKLIKNVIQSTAVGVYVQATYCEMLGNTIIAATNGINCPITTSVAIIWHNTITGGTGNGIDIITGTTVQHSIHGNMITDFGGFGIDLNSSAVSPSISYNRFRDNVGGNIDPSTNDFHTITNIGNVTTDTGGPETDYVSAGTGNYNLIAASPAVNAVLGGASMGAFQRNQTGGGEISSTFAH